MIEQESLEEEVNKFNDPSFLEYFEQSDALLDAFPLRKESVIGDRMFSFTNGKVAFAISLAETPDSFVVAHPLLLSSSDNGHLTGKAMSPSPVARILKSSCWLVSPPLDLHRYVYLKYLLEDLEELPSILSGKRLEEAVKFVQDFTKTYPILVERIRGDNQPSKKTESKPIVVTNKSKLKH